MKPLMAPTHGSSGPKSVALTGLLTNNVSASVGLWWWPRNRSSTKVILSLKKKHCLVGLKNGGENVFEVICLSKKKSNINTTFLRKLLKNYSDWILNVSTR